MEPIFFDEIKVFNSISIDESEELAVFFRVNDYLLLKNVLTYEIKQYLKTNITFNNRDSSNDKLQFYRDHADETCSQFINRFFLTIKPFYNYILKIDLSRFIGFSMKYNKNSDCLPHYDNYNMPISSTICFYNEDRVTYPLYIDKAYFNNPHPFRLTVYDKNGIPEENKIKMDINEGDIGIFRGRNHLHWRDKLPVKDYRALLLHTEDYIYNNELISYIDDNCKKVNITNIKNINTFSLTDIDSYEEFRKNYVMYFSKNQYIN